MFDRNGQNPSHLRGILIPLVLFLGIPAMTAAQTQTTPDVAEQRTVGDYRFIPSSLVTDPFLTTHFNSAVGVALAFDIDIPILVIEEDTLLALNGNLAFVLVGFEYQFAPDDRIAFRIGGSILARVGTGGEAILSQGVTALNTIKAGTTIRLHKSDSFMLSGLLDAGSSSSLRIDLVQFASDLIDFGPRGASLVQEDDGFRLTAGLSGAWVASRWSGLVAFLEGGFINSVRIDQGGYRAGVAGSLDFGQKGGTPIGLLVGFTIDSFTSKLLEGGTTFGGVVGVMYTGRDDFSLGLEMGLRRIPLEDTEINFNRSSYALVARYYF